MFGQQNDQPKNDSIPEQTIDNVGTDSATVVAPVTMPQNDTSQAWQHPGLPIDQVAPTEAEATSSQTVISTPPLPVTTPGTDDLIDIKQQALSQLSPLVSHLEQSPEEKFRTTMMMIQATDDQSLVKSAYEAAGQITDEKVRAQALLDIVNEINYFTQHHPDQQTAEA